MNSYEFFEDLVNSLEKLQENLDSLRELVKEKIRESGQKEAFTHNE